MDALHRELGRFGSGGLPTLHHGRAWPMGATVDADGVNFAVFSAHASKVELCLFDDAGAEELQRLPLRALSGDVWHGHLAGARPGLVYGFRVHGPWRPDRGHRFNPHKVLLDPCAREIVGHFEWQPAQFGADREHPQHMDMRDNAHMALKARVVHDDYDWQGDRPPRTALADSVICELHVRGFTMQHPGVPVAQRGRYTGLGSDAAIAHLQRLGVTAVSLLPVHQFIDEERLAAQGLRNHWGYNTVGYFCPEPRYASAPGRAARDEFREMVRRLHAAGLEVLLDVVYNHTAEGDERGPTISLRGFDNASWYWLGASNKALYENWTGCGNTLDIRHPRVLQMVMDSLRYWVREMHVDGFRFDLAPVLGRGDHGFAGHAPLFQALTQDPLLAGVKLIAEPWDVGPGGYRLGEFPRGWLEWNDRFRDTTRAFWLGGHGSAEACTRGEFAQRLCASSDIFQPRRRSPGESVNFVTAHDGFTLADLVSYNGRHNELNLEHNHDGHGHNLSWNCGVEGPSADREVIARRQRLQRALLATTLLAQGTPMFAAGSELGHTQGGNNNAYCQDNPLSWIDWANADEALCDFTAHVIALRKRLLPLDSHWYTGLADARGRHDLAWLAAHGDALTPADWGQRGARVIGAAIGAPGRGSAPLLLLFNAGETDVDFTLPAGRWRALLDSAEPDGRSGWQRVGDAGFALRARSVALLIDG